MDSSPGYPYTRLAGTNAVLLDNYMDTVVSCVLERLDLFADLELKEICSLSPIDLVRRGLFDPIKLFIKNEPHKLKKIEEGKLRLIASVSVVDQIVSRLIHGLQNEAEIERWVFCPAKPGMGLDDQSLHVLKATFERMSRIGQLAESDISGWDWGVHGWELKAAADIRCHVAGAAEDDVFTHFVQAVSHCVSNKVFVLPSGEMWSQSRPGIQASGQYCTSSDNSRMRIADAVYVLAKGYGFEWVAEREIMDLVAAMGDDAVEVFSPSAEDLYKNDLGKKVKDYVVRADPDDVNFCSSQFVKGGMAYPTSADRTLFRFLSQKATPGVDWIGLLAQLAFQLRHHPERDLLLSVALSRVERDKLLD
nr:MAG: putative RNA-dependent RNA polymerase [Barnaviridae sp.]